MKNSFLPGQINFKPRSLKFDRPTAQGVGRQGVRNTQHTLIQNIRKTRLGLDQLRVKLRVLEEKRQKTLSPVYRQGADRQIQALKKQIQPLFQEWHSLRSQERAQKLIGFIQAVKASPTIEKTEQVLQTLYFQPKTFPTEASAKTVRDILNQLMAQFKNRNLDPELANQIRDLNQFSFITREEQTALLQIYQVLSDSKATGENHTEEKAKQASGTLSEEDSEAAERAQKKLTAMKETSGELEVSFDFVNKTSRVQNQMGICVNQTKKTYQEYLDQGFQSIEEVVVGEFTNMNPFQEAIESFLEAINLNKEKHEAYFGLGYLYSLVRDLNHSLYFLDIAYKISGNASILTFMEKVTSTYAV